MYPQKKIIQYSILFQTETKYFHFIITILKILILRKFNISWFKIFFLTNMI